MQTSKFYVMFLFCILCVSGMRFNVIKRVCTGFAALSFGLTAYDVLPEVAMAKASLPELEKCFNAVRKELDPKQGKSLIRINDDIETENWDDLKLFTREYDAGFRGGVLKSAWKQLGPAKQSGITISNSFTFDLIALNKAARTEDKEAARAMAEAIRNDLAEFLKLEPSATASLNL